MLPEPDGSRQVVAGLFVMALQTERAAFEIHNQKMTYRGGSPDGAMDVMAGSAFDGLGRSLQLPGEDRARTEGGSRLEIRIGEARGRVTYANRMHVRQISAAAEGLNGEAGSVSAYPAVAVEGGFAVALVDCDGTVMATQTGH